MGKRLFVGKLPYSVRDSELTELFSQAGTVDFAQVISDRETGRSKGFGFVEMSTDAEAQKAIELFNGYQMSGLTLAVNEARPKEDRPRGGGGFGGGGFGGGGFGGGGYGGGGGRGGRGGGFGGRDEYGYGGDDDDRRGGRGGFDRGGRGGGRGGRDDRRRRY